MRQSGGKTVTFASVGSRARALAVIGMMGSVVLMSQAPPQQPPAGVPAGPPGNGPEGRGPEGAGGRGRGGRGPLGGAAAGFVLNPELDKTPPALPADLKPGGVLIFSKTSGFREEAAIQASDAALSVIAKEHGWPYFVTENGAIMNPDQLAKFKVVVWNNNSGDILTEEQRAAFKSWIENGGASLGIHGAGGDPAAFASPRTASAWKWYIDEVIGAQFVVHSPIMPADVHVEDAKSRITKGLPPVWHRTDEWYSFADNPRGKASFHILATVDEKSYTPGRATMGTDHPLAWWHCVGKGHAMYSALGHGGMMYTEPLMIQFLDNAMSWAVAESGHACAAEK
jgi:type 1 glutamine amidotransferase